MNHRVTRELADGVVSGVGRMRHGFERDGDRGRPGDRVPTIVIADGGGAGRDEEIGTVCVIGRAVDADIVLQDLGISRRHAAIARQGEAYVIRDLESCNGTTVNGRRVRSATLCDGDVIRLGRVKLLFRWSGLRAGNAASTLEARPAYGA